MGNLNLINKGRLLAFGIFLSSGIIFAQTTDSNALSQSGQQPTVDNGLAELKQEINNELSSLRDQSAQANVSSSDSFPLDDRIDQVEKQLARINKLLESSQSTAPNQIAPNDEQTELATARSQIQVNQERIAELERLLEQNSGNQLNDGQNTIDTNSVAYPAGTQSTSPWKLLGIAAAVLLGGFLLLRTPQHKLDDDDYYDAPPLPEVPKDNESPQARQSYAQDAPLGNLQSQVDSTKPYSPANRTDPVAIAAAHLAAKRKPQAIETLENALAKHPNQGLVASRLLYLYRSIDDISAFSELYHSSIAPLQQEEDWNKINTMAKTFFKHHGIQLNTAVDQKQNEYALEPEDSISDDLVSDTSTPVETISDEFVSDTSPPVETISDEFVSATSPPVETVSDDIVSKDPTPDGLTPDEPALNDPIDNMLAAIETIDDDGPDLQLGQQHEHAEENEVSINQIPAKDDIADFTDSIILMLDESLDSTVTKDPSALLSQAKEYIASGDKNIAMEFLNDVISADDGDLAAEAEVLIASLNS